MKKFIVFLAVMAFSVVSVDAFAQGRGGGWGGGYGHGGCGWWNGGNHSGGGGWWHNRNHGGEYGFGGETSQMSESEAKDAVQKHVTANFKGWKVGKAVVEQTPRGVIHSVEATDASGNKFFFGVNHWGNVGGPFPAY